jgi:hypothetical protein
VQVGAAVLAGIVAYVAVTASFRMQELTLLRDLAFRRFGRR